MGLSGTHRISVYVLCWAGGLDYFSVIWFVALCPLGRPSSILGLIIWESSSVRAGNELWVATVAIMDDGY